MPLIVNPVHPFLYERALRADRALICVSGGVGSSRHHTASELLSLLGEEPQWIGGFVGEIRKDHHFWGVEEILKVGVAITTIEADCALDALLRLRTAAFEREAWVNLPVGSIIANQTLIPSLEHRQTLTGVQVLERNKGDIGIKDLLGRIELCAKGRDTSKVRFAEILDPDDETSALIQGFLLGSDLEQSDDTWRKLKAVNPTIARQIRPYHLLVTEWFEIDEALRALILDGEARNIRAYVEQMAYICKKDLAIEAMLNGQLDPCEVEFAFGLLGD